MENEVRTDSSRTRTILQYLLWCALAYAAAYGATFFLALPDPTPLSAVVFGVFLWLQFRRKTPPSRRVVMVSACVSVFYSVCIALYQYAALGTSGGFFSFHTVIVLISCWALFFVPFTCIYQAWSGIKGDAVQPTKPQLTRLFWIAFATMLLLWLPMYLMYFPGRVCYDSTVQMDEIVNHIPRNHHPFLQSMLMKGILGIGVALFGTPNGGVAVYCMLQMLCFALLFAYTIVTMREFHVKRWFCILTLLFFALEPNVMYRSQVIEKDGTFAFMVQLFLVAFWRLIVFIRRGDSLKMHKRDVVLLSIGALGFCTMRTNGFYTFLPFTILLLFALKKEFRVVKCICSAACLLTLTYLLLIPRLGIINPDIVEALSIPLQNVARVLHDDGNITEDELALLQNVADPNDAAEYYTPYTSDTIKNWIRDYGNQAYLKTHAKEFLQLWIRVGLRNPRLYLYAWIDETCGYWSPQYISPRVHYNDTGDMKDYLVGNSYGYYADPVLPDSGIRIVQSWMVNAKTLPVIALFRNIGTATWLAVAALGASIVRKQRYALLLHAPFAILFAILLVTTPYNTEYRYLYPLLIALPVLYAIALYSDETLRHEPKSC